MELIQNQREFKLSKQQMSLSSDNWFTIFQFVDSKTIFNFLLIGKITNELKKNDSFYHSVLLKKTNEITKWKFPLGIEFKKVSSWKESLVQWFDLYKNYKNEGSFELMLKSQEKKLALKNPSLSSLSILIYFEDKGISGEKCPFCKTLLEEKCIYCQANESVKICPMTIGSCKHPYHSHCMDRWFLTREVCPRDNKFWIEEYLIGL